MHWCLQQLLSLYNNICIIIFTQIWVQSFNNLDILQSSIFIKLVLTRLVFILILLVEQQFFWWNTFRIRIRHCFGFTNLPVILFPMNSALVAPWTSFSERVSKHLILEQYPIFFSNIWHKTISFDIFSCFWFYKITCHFKLLISNVKLTLSFISNVLPFRSVKTVCCQTDSWFQVLAILAYIALFLALIFN